MFLCKRALLAVYPICATLYILFITGGCLPFKDKLEFGGVLRRQVTQIKDSDNDVQRVLQFLIKYVSARSPWSLPARNRNSGSLKQPQIANISKVDLIYTRDDQGPLYYDAQIRDKFGRSHGFTSLILMGSMYRLALLWRQKTLTFTHNFTVSVCPLNNIHVYSHTYLVEYMNVTESNLPRYLTAKHLQLVFESKSTKEVFHMVSNDLNQLDQSDLVNPSHMGNMDQSDACLADQSSCKSQEDIGEEPEMKYLKYGSGTFKVMTYNIWNMNAKWKKSGEYTKRMNRLRQVILDAEPDILGLQEVRYEESKGEDLGPSQMQTIAGWFPEYQFVFQPGQMQPNTLHEGRTEEGVAILSRFPILSHQYHLLFVNKSNTADQHQRVLLHAEILIPLFGKFHVFNTHLSLSHEAREESVKEIWQFMNVQEEAAILLGDLNAEPQEKAIQFLAGKDTLDVRMAADLVDVWTLVSGGQSSGFTYNALEKALSKRIDYMYLKMSGDCCKVEDCQTLDDGRRGSKAASDHVPLLAVLSFNHGKTVR